MLNRIASGSKVVDSTGDGDHMDFHMQRPSAEGSWLNSEARAAWVRIFLASMLLILFLVPVRAPMFGYGMADMFDRPIRLLVAVLATVYDAAFVLAVMLLFAGAVWLLQRVRRGPVWIARAYLAVAVLILTAGVVNISMVHWIGGPLNYTWLRYADPFRSRDVWASIYAAVEARNLIMLLIWIGTYVSCNSLLANPITRSVERFSWVRLGCIAVVLSMVPSLPIVHAWWAAKRSSDISRLANPVWAFGASVFSAGKAPVLARIPTSHGPDEFKTARRLFHEGKIDVLPECAAPSAQGVKNVIFFVLESVPASYLGLYGAKYGVTPNLDRWADQALVLEKAYAHIPSTTTTLSTLMTGAYPVVGFNNVAKDVDHLPENQSIISILNGRQYHTGYFASASLRYMNARNYLKYIIGFDTIEDMHDRRTTAAERKYKTSEWAGDYDHVTVQSAWEWIADGGKRPFFATIWTNQTHHPYFVRHGERENRTGDGLFDRYLLALREVDEAFGVLMDNLEKADLLDSTLVVVVGDHGEAFGQHGQWGHGGHIYQENVRVPLLLINRRLFAGERFSANVGMVDVIPTVVKLLDVPPPIEWHGDCIFCAGRSNRTFFMSKWRDLLIGYRQDNVKVIFNANRQTQEVYDLGSDPDEKEDLSGKWGPSLDESIDLLAGWFQFVESEYKRVPDSAKGDGGKARGVRK